MKYSIIIPTYNHCDDLLKPCLESIIKQTNLNDIEVIIIANGCSDNTRQYVESLGHPFNLIWVEKPVGYTKATNIGIMVSSGEFIVLMNNDTVLLDSAKDYWLDLLAQPFKTDPKTGITGPVKFSFNCGNSTFESMAFWLVMMRKTLINELGLLDEIFSPGMGEDADFSIKAMNAGYTLVSVPEDKTVKFGQEPVLQNFPVWHKGNGTFSDNDQEKNAIIKRNDQILLDRYRKKPTISIVIPTYNHCDDLLKPCIESIIKYSNMDDIEIIISANGCTDSTREYLNTLTCNHKVIWTDEAIGYTCATNLGIKEATGEYIVLLNNDTEFLPQEKNEWIRKMLSPFDKDPLVGMCGPLELFDNYANQYALIFFCVMIKRKVFDEIGILDEIFTPGGGEDIDFSIRLRDAGYKIVHICSTEYNGTTNVGNFPIWHKDNKTFGEITEYSKHIVKRNGLINCKRYNKNIKLNLGAGGINYPGYLSVDLYDDRANILMDITKLDFDDNSVTEILASHVFEHLNPYHTFDILQDWLRVLKPGGKLVMEMPDILELCKRFPEAPLEEKYGLLNAVYGSVNTTGVGGPDNITSPHLFGWWPESIYNHLSAAGYENIQIMDEQIPHPAYNFRVEATKPRVNPIVNIDNDEISCIQAADKEELYKEVVLENCYSITEQQMKDREVIDIGANHGFFSIFATSLGARKVVAIEAIPATFNALKENVKRKGFESKIQTLNNAVSATAGQQIKMSIGEFIGHSSAYNVADQFVMVNSITLSEILNYLEGDKIYLKMDCEGSEYDIILNANEDDMKKISTIVVEIHTELHPTYKGFEIIGDKLKQFGYRQYDVRQLYSWMTNNAGEIYDMKPIPYRVEFWSRV